MLKISDGGRKAPTARSKPNSRRGPRLSRMPYLKLHLAQVALAIVAVLVVFPVFWILLNSFKQPAELLRLPPSFVFSPTIDNYAIVFDRGLVRYFLNSAINSIGATALAIVIGVPAAYSLSRLRARSTQVLVFLLIGLRFIPFIAVALPLYLVMINFGLMGSRWSIILGYQIIVLPVMIWVAKSFFEQIPFDLEEAALIDGCNRFQAFRLVALPLVVPAIATVGIIGFVWCWNEFFLAMMFAGRDFQPLTLGLRQFLAQEETGAQWGPLSAWASIVILPVLLVVVSLSRQLIRGFGGIASDT